VSEATVLRTARYWVDGEGIIRGVLMDGGDFQLKDAMEMMDLHRKLTGDGPRCFLMDITAIRSMPREVRAFFQQPEHVKVHKAVALIVKSPLSRAIGIFLGLNKPVRPTRLFSDEEHAAEWLRAMAGA
jgi:hypothetical protein